jgi:hypothetical protein
MRDVNRFSTHSVAFRVSDAEWKKLGKLADREGVSIGALARKVVLALVNIKVEHGKRRSLNADER